MNINKIKINTLKKINIKLSNEFPDIELKIFKVNNYIQIEIFNSNTKENKFNIIDGGRKNRIIRKLKYLLKINDLEYSHKKNHFFIKN